MKMDRTTGGDGDGRRCEQDLIVQEKLRVLRLLRALDRAGVEPTVEEAIQVPLVRLSEIDALLTALLEFATREDGAPGPDDGGQLQIRPLLPVAEAIRGDVLDALPPRIQKAVRRASTEVTASEAEVMLEVETFRRDAGRSGKGRGAPSGPISEADAQMIAEEAWTGDAPAIRMRVDRRVRANERKAPPDPTAPLRAWFDRTPRPWREVMAQYHDIPKKGDGPLALRLAERIGDAEWMRSFLTDRFGVSEREMLARFLASPVVIIESDDPSLQEALHVPWDWARQFPPSVGGKLRAAGIVHVCGESDLTLAIVPPVLRPMLAELLAEVDPTSATLPERAARHATAELMEDAPFEDDELARWKKADQDLSETLEGWVLGSRDDIGPAIDAVFQDGDRVVYSPEESMALFQYALLDWREAKGQPTLAERLMRDASFGSSEEYALAEAAAASLPMLYRVESAERGRTVTLTPIFPAGDPVVIDDRGMSLTVEPGQVIALRVYPAGPYQFVRIFGLPLEARMEKVMVRALRRQLRAFVRDGGDDAPATFLRLRPWALLRTLREYQD